MQIKECDIWKDKFCNDCHKQNNVKDLYIGESVIALCEDCREKLHGMLYNNYLEETQYDE